MVPKAGRIFYDLTVGHVVQGEGEIAERLNSNTYLGSWLKVGNPTAVVMSPELGERERYVNME